MRFFSSYRNRTIMKRTALIGVGVLLIVALLAGGTLLYLDRYIVYERDGAHLRFDGLEAQAPDVAVPDVEASLSYIAQDDEESLGTSRRITGCYINAEMLRDIENVRETLATKDVYAVMIDMKDIYGNFYYFSSLPGASTAASINATALEELISELRRDGVYLIARIPAFTDQRACLNNTSLGLPLASGVLWADNNNCYWMDPGNPDVLLYLQNICLELQDLGFREVVLNDFHFPFNADSIAYDESEKTKDEVLVSAAQTLQADMDTLGLRLSFGYPAEEEFPLMLTTNRIYFELEDGAKVASVVKLQEASVTTPTMQFVFVTESRDTRFDEYGLLSPLVERAIAAE